MPTAGCFTENRLVDLLDRGCDPAERADVEAHLDECDRCRRLIALLASSSSRPSSSQPSSGTADARPSLPKPGDAVGRYIIEQMIGRGGTGVVYAARDPELGRRVAIKLIRPDLGPLAESVRQRLLRESKALAQLAHPSVIAIHDIGRSRGHVFIAMEFAGGGTLAEWTLRERRTWQAIVSRFILAGRGLEAAHAAGLVHRDFKPDNVLITSDGRVRVADFGMVAAGIEVAAAPAATDLDPATVAPEHIALTQSGTLLGTPRYMAPEQHAGARVGPAADQFAFCVALYEALYGEHPFAATTYLELAERVRTGQLSEATSHTSVPSWLREIVVRGLQVDPEQRWPSMAALLEALDDGLASSADALSLADPTKREAANDLRRRLDLAKELIESGGYSAALPEAQAVSDEASALDHAPLTAEALYWLATLQVRRGDLRDAEATFTRAAVEAARAKDDALIARIWGDLLLVVGSLRVRPGDALLLRPVAEAALARSGDDSPAKARFLNSLGAITGDLGHYDEACQYLVRARVLYTEAFGADHPLVGHPLNNIGRVLTRRGDYDEAQDRLSQALRVWESAFGSSHPLVAVANNNLGELQWELGHYEVARAHHETALAIRDRSLRPDHPWVALSLHNLGEAARGLRSYDEARAYHDRALAIRRQILGTDHPAVADSMNGLGAVFMAQQAYEVACGQHERALAIIEKAFGAEHPRVVACHNHLGDTHRADGRFDQARADHERALSIAEASLGLRHPAVAHTLAALAAVYAQLGRRDEASIAVARGLDIAASRRIAAAVRDNLEAVREELQATDVQP